MAGKAELNCGSIFGCWIASPSARCLAKTGATIALAIGIIVALAGILGVLGAYNVFPKDLAWLGFAGANGLEYAILACACGIALTAVSVWLFRTEPWTH